MMLLKNGSREPIRGGLTLLGIFESAQGRTELVAEDQTTGDSVTCVLDLSPMSPDGFYVHEWERNSALVIWGGERLQVIDARTMEVRASMTFEVKEGRAASQPWLSRSDDGTWLCVTTEWHVWCLDERIAIRWAWSVRSSHKPRIISGPVIIDGDLVRVPIGQVDVTTQVKLRAADGWEIGP